MAELLVVRILPVLPVLPVMPVMPVMPVQMVLPVLPVLQVLPLLPVLPDTHSHTPTRTRPHTRPTTQGEFCCQRGLFCTLGKVRESTKCYLEGTTAHGKVDSAATEDCYVLLGRSKRSQSVIGRARPRTGRSILRPQRIVMYFWEGQREPPIVAGSAIVTPPSLPPLPSPPSHTHTPPHHHHHPPPPSSLPPHTHTAPPPPPGSNRFVALCCVVAKNGRV